MNLKNSHLLFLLSILFLAGFSNSAHGQVSSYFVFKNIPANIQNSVVEANKELFSKDPTLKNLEKIITLFYQTKQFESISVFYEKNKFVVTADNFKTIAKIRVKGNLHISESDIISTFGLSPGDKYTYQNIYDGAERVKDLYGKSGYFNAIVNISPTPSSDGKTLIEILVEEKSFCVIEKIEFSTSFKDLEAQIQKKIQKYNGKPLTEQNVVNIESTVKDYFTSNKILSANVQGPQYDYNKSKTKVTLIYTLDNPYRYILLFEGNNFYSQTELISKFELDERAQQSANPTAELQSKLEKIYLRSGFPNVIIKANETLMPQSFIRRVTFRIQEGPRTFIKGFRFHGTLSRKDSYYSSLFSSSYESSLYDQDKLKKAQQDFLIDLQNQGFLKARFVSFQTNFSEDKKYAEIQFFLDEGPQTLIQNVTFDGIHAFSKVQLLATLGLKEGQPISLPVLENSFQKLVDFYTGNGYLDMEIRSELSSVIKYNSDNTRALITYKIYEGPQVKVGKILVEGNSRTRSGFILNELEFDIGDILTPQKIDDSEYHIQKTGLFSQVEIVNIEKGTSAESRTVLIKVAERDPGLFNFGLGVNTEFEFTVRGYAGVSYNNISGKGRAASIRGEIKQVQDINFLDHRITLGYLEPTLFAKRTRGRVTFIRIREIISRTDDVGDQEAKILESNRLSFLLEKDFTRYFKMSFVTWSISTNKEFLYPNELTIENVNIASIGPILEYDRRDHPFVTRSGYYAKLSSEYGDENLGSSDGVHYLRNIGQVNAYVPFRYRDIVWANSIGGGYLTNIKDSDGSNVPDVKAFKLGGRDTIRGFEPNEIPRDTDRNGNLVRVTSESHYYLFKSELRIPIYGQIESVFFYDGGAVYVKGHEFYDTYRDSVGVGFRYQTPVGPLSIEYGHKLDRNRDLDESPGRFHLSFGMF